MGDLQTLHQDIRQEMDVRRKLDTSILEKLQEQMTSNKMSKHFRQLILKLQKKKTNLVGHLPLPLREGAPGDSGSGEAAQAPSRPHAAESVSGGSASLHCPLLWLWKQHIGIIENLETQKAIKREIPVGDNLS